MPSSFQTIQLQLLHRQTNSLLHTLTPQVQHNSANIALIIPFFSPRLPHSLRFLISCLSLTLSRRTSRGSFNPQTPQQSPTTTTTPSTEESSLLSPTWACSPHFVSRRLADRSRFSAFSVRSSVIIRVVARSRVLLPAFFEPLVDPAKSAACLEVV